MFSSTSLAWFISKRISKTTRLIRSAKIALTNRLILMAAAVSSLFSGKRKKEIPVGSITTKTKGEVVINCMGCTDLRSDPAHIERDIKSIQTILRAADVSLTSTRFGKRNTERYRKIRQILKKNRILNVSHGNQMIHSQMYRTDAGMIAVMSYVQNSMSKKRYLRIRLVREYRILKQLGADYVILYVDGKLQTKVSDKKKRLYNLLLKAGIDYIVGIVPNVCDSGVTALQKNRSVSRAVYSLGTGLSDRTTVPANRAIIRLKLRAVNGKLQAYEEAYYPLRYHAKQGFRDLMKAETEKKRADLNALAEIERSLPRIRRVDKIITVGTIVDVIGATLPEKYAYIKDFSVGRIAARPFHHKPGDVYIRWQPHTDPNDADTYERRVKEARKSTLKAAKIDMFIVSYKDFNLDVPHVVVENAMEAHIAVGTYLRKQHDVRCVAITGSIGKTSTKDMLAEVMKLQYTTVKSEKNENIHSKISLALQRITSDCEVYIQELGGGRPGGASRHSRMVLPEATVVTNIGDAHIGNFYGDQVALMKNKLHIIDGMPEDGIIYLNGDDPLLATAEPGCTKILYAVHNKNADYYADNIVVQGNCTYFDIVHGDHRVPACVNVPGEHNVLNAVCSFAIGKQFGIPEDMIVKGLGNFTTHGIRQNVVNACGMRLFFDCYNASSGSVESSIKTLLDIEIPEHGRRIAVVGDITGLGDLAESTHKEIAYTLIENPADIYIFYGSNTKFTYEIVKEHGFEAYYTSDYEELCNMLAKKAKPGDAVMAKGSSKMKLEYAFDRAFGTRSFDGAMLEEGVYLRTHVGGVSYNLFKTHATAIRPTQNKRNVTVKAKIGTVAVEAIATTFQSDMMETLVLPNTIRHIGTRAFDGSKNLQKVDGLTNVKYIGRAAFRGCSSLTVLELPNTLTHIGSEAFNGCTALKKLHLPGSVAQIGEKAFENCPDLQITCEAGSYAEAYLKENQIAYTCV